MDSFKKSAAEACEVSLSGFKGYEDFKDNEAVVREHNQVVCDFVNEYILEKGEDGLGAGDVIAGWQQATSVDEKRDPAAISAQYLPDGVLNPTYSTTLREDDTARQEYFTHLAGELDHLIVMFKGVNVYPNGLPEESAECGLFTAPEDPAIVVNYSFCGINKKGEWEEREAVGTFSFGENEEGNLKISNHTSAPKEPQMQEKQHLRDQICCLAVPVEKQMFVIPDATDLSAKNEIVLGG